MSDETLPRDAHGRVIPHDSPSLEATDRVIRRISEQWLTPVGGGRRRISTAALEPSSTDADPYEGLSVDLEILILARGDNPAGYVISDKHRGAIVFAVSCFRDKGFKVGPDPTYDNPCHGNVWGNQDTNTSLRPRSVRHRLLREAEWLIEIPDTVIVDD